MAQKLSYISFLLFIALFLSCEVEVGNYSKTPYIEAKGLRSVDSLDVFGQDARLNTIHLYLIDGDGDIGPGPCFNGELYLPGNCYVELYFKEDNEFVKDTNFPIDTLFCGLDTVLMKITEWYTVPYAGDLGLDKTLKADIFIDIEYNTEPQMSYKEFFYTITLFDMALNKSNTVWTDTIVTE